MPSWSCFRLAAIGGVVVALVPRTRERFGLLVAVATVPAVFVAAGAASAREAELMQAHTSIAGSLLPWTMVLAVALVAVVAAG